jgi:foldase protein PrsA
LNSHLRYLAGLSLAGICAVATTGCGDDVPAGAVAKVRDTVITKAQFDHWYSSAAKAQAQQGGPAVAPEPPNYTKCVTALKEAQKEAQPKGVPVAFEQADLKRQCKQSYDQLRQQVMQFLIQSQWVVQEAEEQDISVSGKEVRQLFEDQKKQSFPKEKDYRKFLRTSGATEQDILFRIKLDALQNKLTAKVQKEQEKITDEDIEGYYEKNKKRFGQPERRDLNIVLTKTKTRAEQAKRELDEGAKFPAVAKKYSIDQASKANGGKLPDVPPGQHEKPFNDAIFSAKRGEIHDPVKTQFGWYVFEVTDVTESSQQKLGDAEEAIRGLLRSEREQKSLQDFIEDFREEGKEETNCADEFVVAECSNAPEEDTNTAPASGGAPGAPPAAPSAPGAPGAPGAPPSPTPAPQPAP